MRLVTLELALILHHRLHLFKLGDELAKQVVLAHVVRLVLGVDHGAALVALGSRTAAHLLVRELVFALEEHAAFFLALDHFLGALVIVPFLLTDRVKRIAGLALHEPLRALLKMRHRVNKAIVFGAAL